VSKILVGLLSLLTLEAVVNEPGDEAEAVEAVLEPKEEGGMSVVLMPRPWCADPVETETGTLAFGFCDALRVGTGALEGTT